MDIGSGSGFGDLEHLFGRVEEVTAALTHVGAEREAGVSLLVERCQLLSARNQELAETARHYYDEARTIEGREQALAGQVQDLQRQVEHLNALVARSMDSLGVSHQRMASDSLVISQALRDTVPAEMAELSLGARRPAPVRRQPAALAPQAPISQIRAQPARIDVHEGDEELDIAAAASGFSGLMGRAAAAPAA